MTGRHVGTAFDAKGNALLTFSLPRDVLGEVDGWKDKDLDIEIEVHRKKRSLDANAYCWVLCSKIADKLANEDPRQTKEEVYRAAIRDVGIYKDFPNLSPDDAKTLRTAWEMLGTGWVTEQVDFSHDGETVTIRCYYGSSRYSTKQMSRLLDWLVASAREQGIEVLPPDKLERMITLWR